MKKTSATIFLLLAFYLALQIPHTRALEKTLEETTPRCRYAVYVKAPDTWQVGTQIELTARLTLIQKGIEGREFGYVTNDSTVFGLLHWWVIGGKNYTEYIPGVLVDVPLRQYLVRWAFIEYDEVMNLTEVGDYWEMQLQGEISDRSEGRLGRGETANATLYVKFSLAEFSANHTLLNVPYAGGNIGNIVVFRPFLSMVEAVAVAGIGAVGVALAFLHRSGRFSLFQFFSKLSVKYPFLTRVGSLINIVTIWTLFVGSIFFAMLAPGQQFSLAVYIAFALVAIVFVFLTVGLLEFVLEGWGMLQTTFGFIVTIFVLFILYLAVEFLLLYQLR